MVAAEDIARRDGVAGVGRGLHTMVVRVICWLPVALVAAAAMLVSILIVALLSGEVRQVPASGPPFVIGNVSDAAGIFGENLFVLLLYAMGNVGVSVVQRQRACAAQPMTVPRTLLSRLAIAMVVGCSCWWLAGRRLFSATGSQGSPTIST
jgi:hypothetical protein